MPATADAMRRHIEETYHWRCEVPIYLDAALVGNVGVDPCVAVANATTAHSVPASVVAGEQPWRIKVTVARSMRNDPDQSAYGACLTQWRYEIVQGIIT
ncbi:hypothetical protein GNZ11_20440 [Paraburkholderia xenovorans]|nr:hypothetical protein [Paraburkholderia xenovorans]